MDERQAFFHDWERAAARELAEIQFLLSCGVFAAPGDLCDRLHSAAKAIREQYSDLFASHEDPWKPGPPDDFWEMKG